MLLNTRSRPVLEGIPVSGPVAVSRFLLAGKDGPRPVRLASSLHYNGIPPPGRISWLAVLVSAGFHAGLILGLNHHSPPPKHVVVEDPPAAEILMMPDLSEPEEDKPRELNDDDQLTPPAVNVPMLMDVPVLMPQSSSFVQELDLTIPLKSDPNAGKLVSIPTNILHGRPDDSSIKNLFNITELDRVPEPIVRTPPVFPYEMKREGVTARVRAGFIVDSQGNVIMPYIVSSTHTGFERSAIEAIKKWKFRPGMKGGRKVNTRVEQPIDFKVSEDDLN